MVHTAIVLPQDLLARLKTDAEASGHGLSTEIRQLLQLHYLMPARRDPETNNLLQAIKVLSEILAHDMGGTKWHEHPYALAAFKAGVEAFLARYHPKGDEKVRPDTLVAGEPDDPPDIVGRTHARRVGIESHEDESAEPEWESD